MKTIAICNQKGGVGKTTTAIELAVCLHNKNKKVLLVDFDQQGNLSQYVDISKDKNIYGVLHVDYPLEEAIQSKEFFDVIASSKQLTRADREFIGQDDVYLLSDVFEMISDRYDFVIIDNSPSRNILLNMAYVAADYVIVPTECDAGSISGILAIEEDIKSLRESRNAMSHATIAAIILTKYEKTIMHETAKEELEEIASTEIKGNPFVMIVRKSIRASEAKSMLKSMQEYDKYGNPATDYRKITDKLLKEV